MDKQLQRVFAIYKRLVEIHILTKTTDKNGFHKDTEDAYENAFDVFHKIKELNQDIEVDTPEEVSKVASEAYELQEEVSGIVKELVKTNSDIAMDELLRGLSLSTAGICGSLRKHI
jgi:hypothetical protein